MILSTYCSHADTELHYRTEKWSGQRLSNQSQYDWNEPDDETEKGFYSSEHLHTVWDNLGNSTKANFSMGAEKEINPSRRLQMGWDNPEETIKLKDDMKRGKGINAAKSSISQQNAPEKERWFPGKPDSGLNSKNQKSKNSNN